MARYSTLLIALAFSLTFLIRDIYTTQTKTNGQERHLAHTIDIPLSSEQPSMGSASPDATVSLSIAQLTLTGPVFPYIASTSGLNKTDASFAALIRRCLGEEGPP